MLGAETLTTNPDQKLNRMHLNTTHEQEKKNKLQTEFLNICKGIEIKKKPEEFSREDREKVFSDILKFLENEPSFDINFFDFVGFTPAHYLVGRGNLMALNYLTHHKALKLDEKGYQNWTLIVNACYFGQLDVLQFLIDQNVNLHPNLSGKSLAHIAALRMDSKITFEEFASKRSQIFTLLSQCGIDLELCDQNTQTYIDVMKHNLLENPNALDPLNRNYLHWAAIYPSLRDTQDFNRLLKDRATVQKRDEHGNTPLTYAASMGAIELYNQLLPLSDITNKNQGNLNVLHFVVAKAQNTSAIIALLNGGLDPFDEDILGQNAFDIAFKCGCIENLKILQEYTLPNLLGRKLERPAVSIVCGAAPTPALITKGFDDNNKDPIPIQKDVAADETRSCLKNALVR